MRLMLSRSGAGVAGHGSGSGILVNGPGLAAIRRRHGGGIVRHHSVAPAPASSLAGSTPAWARARARIAFVAYYYAITGHNRASGTNSCFRALAIVITIMLD